MPASDPVSGDVKRGRAWGYASFLLAAQRVYAKEDAGALIRGKVCCLQDYCLTDVVHSDNLTQRTR